MYSMPDNKVDFDLIFEKLCSQSASYFLLLQSTILNYNSVTLNLKLWHETNKQKFYSINIVKTVTNFMRNVRESCNVHGKSIICYSIINHLISNLVKETLEW